MNINELARRVAAELRANDVRKPVRLPRRTFHISDDDGNHKDFIMQGSGTGVLYTIEDVVNMINACVVVVQEALAVGDSITIRELGTLGLKFHRMHAGKVFNTDIERPEMGLYIPKFAAAKKLRDAGKIYQASLRDDDVSQHALPAFDGEEEDDPLRDTVYDPNYGDIEEDFGDE